MCPHSILFSMENVSIFCWSPSVVYMGPLVSLHRSFKLITEQIIFLEVTVVYEEAMPILSSMECKAFSFALQLKSHNHLYPKEIWAFNSFEAKPHNNNFFFFFFNVAFFISGLHKALWFMELFVSREKSWFFLPPAKHRPVVLPQCLVTRDHCSNLEKPSSDRLYQTYFEKEIVVFS